jgi:type III restriction enzyme
MFITTTSKVGYTIEHILPQNEALSAQWQTELGPEWSRVQQEWLHTLGNLTLTGYNSQYSDHPFEYKRDRVGDFKRNPQQFIELTADAINRCKRMALVDGIKYQRLGQDEYYAQELFESQELTGYLKNLVEDTKKSVYQHVVYDSAIERDFAVDLERNEAVKVYAKLPAWFKVPTPLGTYNPDWAVLIELDGQEKLYFVVETKSSLFDDDLRTREGGQIKCGAAHFNALAAEENPVIYEKLKDVEGLINRARGLS